MAGSPLQNAEAPGEHSSALSPRDAPEFCNVSPSRKSEGAGKPDARCTRGLVCNVHKKVRTRAYRSAENIRHSLRNGFTAYNVLSPENGSFASVAP